MQHRGYRRRGFNPWVRKIPWRRKWQPTPVFLPGESHGQRSLAGSGPQGHKRVGQDSVTKQLSEQNATTFLKSLPLNPNLFDSVAVPVAQSCPTLCDPTDYRTRLLCPWDSPGGNSAVGCHFLLQGIFPTQGSNPCLLHCRQILYHLSYREVPLLKERQIFMNFRETY